MIEKPCIANITRIYRKHESPIHFNKKILSIYNINKKNRVKEKIREKKCEFTCLYRRKYQNMKEKKLQ
jgi:hypothetical protein